jgi:predicted RNase H-like HicB family nuclease
METVEDIVEQNIVEQNISLTLNQSDGLLNCGFIVYASNQNNSLITNSQPILTMIMGKNIKDSLFFFVEEQEEGGFVAFSREFVGAIGQGETAEDAIADIEEAIRLLKEVIDEDKASENKK